jgi:hypothetical protein
VAATIDFKDVKSQPRRESDSKLVRMVGLHPCADRLSATGVAKLLRVRTDGQGDGRADDSRRRAPEDTGAPGEALPAPHDPRVDGKLRQIPAKMYLVDERAGIFQAHYRNAPSREKLGTRSGSTPPSAARAISSG